METTERIACWQEKLADETLRHQFEELVAQGDDQALENAFFRELEFGTGGLRGELGVGSNRMNRITVAQATQGLANYLNGLDGNNIRSVAIAYDSRINSDLFSQVAAGVLAANGIRAYLYPRLEPTPALSFAVRYLGCDAGICVTASHNPSHYNGYKVYGKDGCQITTQMAHDIQAAINTVDAFDDVREKSFAAARESGEAVYIPETGIDAFIEAVLDQTVEKETSETPLRVVYTPLNGTGLECVTKILDRINITDVYLVSEQKDPDGLFPTCPFPNPEIRETLKKGIELCEQVDADLLLATDPDADRVGIAVKHEGRYELLTGNEVGILLFDYVCRQRSATHTMPTNPIVVTTIVSSDMIDPIASAYGVEVRRTLTGFKYIGEQIGFLEQEGHVQRFIFGFEESYGYLSGTHVRDKDAINTSMLICQMARHYRSKNKSLVDAINSLYAEFGFYRNELLNFSFEGAAGVRAMTQMMQSLRANLPEELGGLSVISVVDYLAGIDNLPQADVLEFRLEGGNKVLIRPSGTEPKVKAYLSVNASSTEAANNRCDYLRKAVNALIGS
jgi:phosphoglucomutase